MASSTQRIRPRVGASIISVLLIVAACGDGRAPENAGASTTTATTRLGAFSTPEALAAAFATAIRDRDEAALRSVWPPATWNQVGREILQGFVPGEDPPGCQLRSATEAWCVVFERDWPRALELTMTEGATGWTVDTAILESTN